MRKGCALSISAHAGGRIQNQEEDWTRYLRWGRSEASAAPAADAAPSSKHSVVKYPALSEDLQHHPVIK